MPVWLILIMIGAVLVIAAHTLDLFGPEVRQLARFAGIVLMLFGVVLGVIAVLLPMVS